MTEAATETVKKAKRRGTEVSETWGQVTEAELERLLARKGVPRDTQGSLMRRPKVSDTKADLVIRRGACGEAARAFGDMNPLYHDVEYAERSIWGHLLCPPGVLSRTDKVNGATDGFPGCHTIWRGCDLEWKRPIFEGDGLVSVSYLTDARLVESKFGGGKNAVQDYETEISLLDGEVVGFYRTSWHRFSRKGAKESSKYVDRTRPQWTDEDLEAVWDEYARQNLSNRRGERPLYWEDVEEGTDIPYIIKGPTTLTSKLAFEIRGPGGWLVGHELARELWQQYPALAIRNEENVPEPPVAIHWTNERCQKYLGMPAAYEAGYERLNWLTQMLMYWIGDHGMPAKLSMQFRGFHWQGDVVRLYGRVTDKEVSSDGRHLVNLNIETRSHRDETTTKGTAQVELPSRKAGKEIWPR